MPFTTVLVRLLFSLCMLSLAACDGQWILETQAGVSIIAPFDSISYEANYDYYNHITLVSHKSAQAEDCSFLGSIVLYNEIYEDRYFGHHYDAEEDLNVFALSAFHSQKDRAIRYYTEESGGDLADIKEEYGSIYVKFDTYSCL